MLLYFYIMLVVGYWQRLLLCGVGLVLRILCCYVVHHFNSRGLSLSLYIMLISLLRGYCWCADRFLSMICFMISIWGCVLIAISPVIYSSASESFGDDK